MISATTIILLIIIGLLSATLASLIGLGGGLISVPMIMLVMKDNSEVSKLIGYINIIALSLVSSFFYFRQKRKPKFKEATLILIGVVPSTILSLIYLAPLVDGTNTKRWFYLAYIFIVIIVMIIVAMKEKLKRFNIKSWLLPMAGLPIGLLSGTMGLSGGVLFVPLLVSIVKMNVKEAAVTALLMKLVTAVANVSTKGAIGIQDWGVLPNVGYLFIVVPGAIVGSRIGTWLNKKISAKHIEWIFFVALSAVLIEQIVKFILTFYN